MREAKKANIYFYDPLQKWLYIFWEYLDELEWNGPNFSYIVETDQN